MKTWRDYGIEIDGEFSGERRVVCPECSSSRRKSTEKCLTCNGDNKTWFCHHCDWSGVLEGKDWKPKEYSRPAVTESKLPEKVLEWFGGRGISVETLEFSRVSYGETYMPQEDKVVGAIQFVYYRGDDPVNIKYRDAKKNFRQVKDAEKIVYGYNDILNKKEIIIVEGEIDKLSLMEAGFYSCFSVPDGAPSPTASNYRSKFTYLESIEDILSDATKVIIMADNDAPGKKLAEELGRRIGKEKCWLTNYPSDCKDANEILVKHGVETLKEIVGDAHRMPVEGIITVEEIYDDVLDLYDKGLKKGISTGIQCVDDLYTIRKGEWTVVTGIPGHGKSEFVDNLMINLIFDHKWRVAMFSPENHPPARHLSKLIEKYAETPLVEGFTARLPRDEVKEAMSHLKDEMRFIMPSEEDMSLEKILELARVSVYRDGIQGLVIDPWNEIEHVRPSGMTETEYISQSLSKIRRFARFYDLHIWVVAHPTKLMKDALGGYPVPTPYDVSGSANWRNKSDNALAIYRDLETDEVQLHVQKIRFREVGKIGVTQLAYNKVCGKYSTVQKKT